MQISPVVQMDSRLSRIVLNEGERLVNLGRDALNNEETPKTFTCLLAIQRECLRHAHFRE